MCSLSAVSVWVGKPVPVTTTLREGGLCCPSYMPHAIHIAQAWAPPFPCPPCAWIGRQFSRTRQPPPPRQSAHRDLDGQQALPCVLCINGELHRQAGRHASGIEPRATGLHLAGIMRRQHLDLEGAVGPACRKQLGSLSMPSPPPAAPGSGPPLTCGAPPLPRTAQRCCMALRGWARS